MSYEIVKKIRIDNNKVFITSESNNVYPKYYTEGENTYGTEILQQKGMDELNISLLKAYEDGGFQEGVPNKWSRAIQRLKAEKEYQKYNWHNSDYSENCPIQAARRTKEFEVFLLSALSLKPSSEKYIVKKTNDVGNDLFVLRVTIRKIKLTSDRAAAKIFRIKQDATRITDMFPQYSIINI